MSPADLPASSDLSVPDAMVARPRWIPAHLRDWVADADKIMLEHGVVTSTKLYRERHHARWRAQRLIRLMVELRVHERWQLKEHTERRAGGWGWNVEYIPKEDK